MYVSCCWYGTQEVRCRVENIGNRPNPFVKPNVKLMSNWRTWCPGNPDCDDPKMLCQDLVDDYHAFQVIFKYETTKKEIGSYWTCPFLRCLWRSFRTDTCKWCSFQRNDRRAMRKCTAWLMSFWAFTVTQNIFSSLVLVTKKDVFLLSKCCIQVI